MKGLPRSQMEPVAYLLQLGTTAHYIPHKEDKESITVYFIWLNFKIKMVSFNFAMHIIFPINKLVDIKH